MKHTIYDLKQMQSLPLKLYENDRHEILNETDKDVVYKDLGNWIMRQISDINNSNNL